METSLTELPPAPSAPRSPVPANPASTPPVPTHFAPRPPVPANPASAPPVPMQSAPRPPAPAKPVPEKFVRRPRRHVAVEDDMDAWLMSFADLVTLMLALFVVLYAASRIDATKAEQIKESLTKTLTKSKPSNQPVPKQFGYNDLAREIQAELIALGLEGLARVQLVPTGVALVATGDMVFTSGSAEITPRATDLLSKVSNLVIRLPYAIRVEGHTDDIPIRTQQFPSNWELSAARAGRVARFLIEHGILPSRLAVTGYADTRPLPTVTGATDTERRSANRRVVFLFEKEGTTFR